MEQVFALSRGGCKSRHALNEFWIDDFNGSYSYRGWQSGVVISDVVRCAGIDGFLLPNVSNYYQQHSIRMQELEVGSSHISKMYFSHWKPPGVCERRRSVNLEASSSGENQTLRGHSGQSSEELGSLMTGT